MVSEREHTRDQDRLSRIVTPEGGIAGDDSDALRGDGIARSTALPRHSLRAILRDTQGAALGDGELWIAEGYADLGTERGRRLEGAPDGMAVAELDGDPRKLWVLGKAPRHVPRVVPPRASSATDPPEEDLVIILERPSVLAFTCVTIEGAPIPDALIEAQTPLHAPRSASSAALESAHWARAKTDEHGFAELRVAAGTSFDLRVTCDGFKSIQEVVIAKATGDDEHRTLTLKRIFVAAFRLARSNPRLQRLTYNLAWPGGRARTKLGFEELGLLTPPDKDECRRLLSEKIDLSSVKLCFEVEASAVGLERIARVSVRDIWDPQVIENSPLELRFRPLASFDESSVTEVERQPWNEADGELALRFLGWGGKPMLLDPTCWSIRGMDRGEAVTSALPQVLLGEPTLERPEAPHLFALPARELRIEPDGPIGRSGAFFSPQSVRVPEGGRCSVDIEIDLDQVIGVVPRVVDEQGRDLPGYMLSLSGGPIGSAKYSVMSRGGHFGAYAPEKPLILRRLEQGWSFRAWAAGYEMQERVLFRGGTAPPHTVQEVLFVLRKSDGERR